MIKEVIATGRTVDAAIDNGCSELGKERGDIDFEIISMPRKGFLGLSQSPAKVRVFIELPDPAPEKPAPKTTPVPAPIVSAPAPVTPAATVRKADPISVKELPVKAEPAPVLVGQEAPAKEPDPAPTEPVIPCDFGNKIEVVQSYVNAILQGMKLTDVTTTVTTRENVIHIKLNGDVSGVAIGRHGETLDALQYLAGLAANRGEGDYVRVVLDSGNYRDKRRNTLEQLANRLGAAVLRTGRSTTLEPMNPYERRIIHSTITEMEGVTSASVGEEPNRCVVISAINPPANLPPYQPRDARVPRPASSRPPRRDGDRPFGDRPIGDRPSGDRPPFVRDSRGPRPAGRDGRRDDRRGPRRDKPAPYQESGRREVAPSEGEDKPLYGKIEI